MVAWWWILIASIGGIVVGAVIAWQVLILSIAAYAIKQDQMQS
jgi:hypothetical protein